MTKTPDNTLYLLVNNHQLSGWTESRVTVSLDKTPRDFAIELTDRNPLNSSILDVKPGQSCVVKIGPDFVISGWIDRVKPSYNAKAHSIRILGRSKCQDLVDCSVTPDILTGMLTPADPWIIGDISFVKDADRGTVVDVMLMPKEAFQPEPTILQPFLYDPTAKPPSGGAAAR